MSERRVMAAIEAAPCGDAHEDARAGKGVFFQQAGEEASVVVEMFEDVQKKEEIEPGAGDLARVSKAAVRQVALVIRIPADGLRVRIGFEQAPRRPAVAGADVEDRADPAARNGLFEQGPEERRANGFPRMASEMAGRNFSEIHSVQLERSTDRRTGGMNVWKRRILASSWPRCH